MASAVGMAAIRTCPDSPWRAARISSRMVRASPTMRRAQSSTCSPSGVSPWKREPRCTSITPSWSSSCLMPADSVGWVTPQLRRGAAEMLLLGERDEEFQLVDHCFKRVSNFARTQAVRHRRPPLAGAFVRFGRQTKTECEPWRPADPIELP